MPREEKCGAHVRIDHLVVFDGAGVKQVLVIADADIVDQYVQAAEGLRGIGNALDGRLLVDRISDDIGYSNVVSLRSSGELV